MYYGRDALRGHPCTRDRCRRQPRSALPALRASRQLCTVLFFFPRAFTPGCRVETAAFRDSHAELRQLGAFVVGVSTDDAPTQCRFADFMRAPFPLIADPRGEITRAYDVRWPLLNIAKRVTFVIGPSQIILGTFTASSRSASTTTRCSPSSRS